MRFFDTHAHYNDKQFDDCIFDIINSCVNNYVDKIVLVGASYKDSLSEKNLSIKLNKKFSDKIKFYYSIGCHPDEIVNFEESLYNKQFLNINSLINDSINDDNLVAIGEIGLDYYKKEKTDELIYNQKKWFILQLELAKKYNLPVIIHSRDACQDTKEILKKYLYNNKGIMHCYSYSKEDSKFFLDLGMYLGIGGVVTFKNADKIKETVKYAPLDRIVLETDSPYLSPTPFRGERNDSSKLNYIINEISRLKNKNVNDICDTIYENSLRVYNLL